MCLKIVMTAEIVSQSVNTSVVCIEVSTSCKSGSKSVCNICVLALKIFLYFPKNDFNKVKLCNNDISFNNKIESRH